MQDKINVLDIMAIPLPRGLFALVDGEDYERLNQRKWFFTQTGNNTYVTHQERQAKYVYKTIYMHRKIMNPPRNMEIHHINHNGLDNRKANLRICTPQQNHSNRRKFKGKSKYKGVYWKKLQKQWFAQITSGGKTKHLGYFAIEEEAARAYDKKAKELFGEFARLNNV